MKLQPISLLFIILLAACTPADQTDGLNPSVPAAEVNAQLTVLAAASLIEPFTELGERFENEHPGSQIVFSFAGSQQLARQIVEGAPADVFASASQKYMDMASLAGRVEQDSIHLFSRNRLIIIFPADNPGQIASLSDLAADGIKLALASPEVPAGIYTQEFLANASKDPDFAPTFKQDVLKNVVSWEDNVKSVLTKVQLGEVDAGIVFSSDANVVTGTPPGLLVIPNHLNVIGTYPIAALSDSPNPVLAEEFVELLLSAEGQAVLAKYGFLPMD